MTPLAQALLLLTKRIEDQQNFIVQIGTDVAALRNVLFALDGRAQQMFQAEVARLRGMFEAQLVASRQEFEALRKAIAGLSDQKPN